jgi:phosphotriesterase-related protein
MKNAMTVSGPVPANMLGHILPHEHIIMKFPDYQTTSPIYPEISKEKVSVVILDKIRRDIWSCVDNCQLDEKDVAVEDLLSFKKNGGGTIVDATTLGLGRNIPAIKEISEKSGVNIIVGTGYYVGITHPRELIYLSEKDIEERMLKEVQEEIEDTGVRAGMVGEIGTSALVTPQEEKVLRASLRVHVKTGLPVSIHQFGGVGLKQIHSIVKEEEVETCHVILCHMCMRCSQEERAWAADQGYCVEIDGFGNEFHVNPRVEKIIYDKDRVGMVRNLIERGFLKQVLISQDTAFKIMLKKYGGKGYEHVILNVGPLMLQNGITSDQIQTLLYQNPASTFGCLS